MVEFASLWTTRRPYIHLLPADADVLSIRTSATMQPSTVVELSGRRMRGVDDLFREFVRAFHLPEYFGWNWPAFAECMADLSWYPARAYVLCIQHPELVLDESLADCRTLYRALDGICARWANSFALGPEWGGGEVPFNVALLCEGEAELTVREFAGDYL